MTNERMKRFCVRCERPEVIVVDQEPYGNGMKFIALLCCACSWGKTIRDDWYPERNGTGKP